MYHIDKTEFGFFLTFGGACSAEELKVWLDESRRLLKECYGPFYVLVDMRTLIPLDTAAQKYMNEGQKLYREAGMVRSVVILNSPVIAAQFRRIGGETGIGRFERYIDATATPDWEAVAMDWLLKASDPDEAKKEIDTGKLDYHKS